MKIAIHSGFQRGGRLLAWDGRAFAELARAGENTHRDDRDSSFVREVPDDFKGAVVRFHGVSALTYVSEAQLLGFTAEELSATAPVAGWVSRTIGVRAEKTERVSTFGEWATAMALGNTIIPDPEMMRGGRVHPVSGRRAAAIPFSWGDQRAAAWAVWNKDGSFSGTVEGAGDNTPELVEGEIDWEFPTVEDVRRAAADQLEADEREAAAARWEDHCLHLETACSR